MESSPQEGVGDLDKDHVWVLERKGEGCPVVQKPDH